MKIFFYCSLVFLCTSVVSCGLRVKSWKDGFDAGRADVLAQMHNCISSNDSQWVEIKSFGILDSEISMREYTNRFFTNWVLRVRQP